VFDRQFMYSSSDDGTVREWQLNKLTKEQQKQAEIDKKMYGCVSAYHLWHALDGRLMSTVFP
jgi:uncharacterized protein YxjI